MKPIPIPITTIRQTIKIIGLTGRHGKRILRLAIPVIVAVTEVVQEIKKKS